MQEALKGTTPSSAMASPSSMIISRKVPGLFQWVFCPEGGLKNSPTSWNCYVRDGLVELAIQASLGT